MTGMAISASFPLGVYNGHRSDGGAERIPDFARVYSALVQAAATGTQSTGDPRDPYSDRSKDVLDWLERNPPEALRVPDLTPVSLRTDRISYRREGVFLKESKATNYKVTGRTMSDGTALSGPVQWIWHNPPEESMVVTLSDLCADVPHLGETSSPVVLSIGEAREVTHYRDVTAGVLSHPGEYRQALPRVGRRVELDAAHAVAHLNKKPTIAADRHNVSTLPNAPLPGRSQVETGVYLPEHVEEARLPWTHVLVLPITTRGVIPDEALVSMCVALHRAIVSRLGAEASPLITGRYPTGVVPPANRIALHLLAGDTPGSPFDDGLDRFIVLFPPDTTAEDLGDLATSLGSIRRVVTKEHQVTVAPEQVEVLPGEAFWRPPQPGFYRTWEASPGIVPERFFKATEEIGSLDLAAAWSLGNALRDVHPTLAEKSPTKRWEAATKAGVRFDGRALRTANARAYVHRTNRRHPVHPFRAELDLHAVVPDRAIIALGQSRHLGCGLLIPVDRPRQHLEEKHD